MRTTWEAPLYLTPALIPQVGIISKLTNSPGLPGSWASLVAQTGKNLPVMQETWVRSLVWEDPLEEGMATHISTLAWRILMDRGALRATVHGVAKRWTRLSD